jgi:uncharacterized OsmC-like protein
MSATKITLNRIGEPFHFEAKNAAGNRCTSTPAWQLAAPAKGVRPMELLLMGLAGLLGHRRHHNSAEAAAND